MMHNKLAQYAFSIICLIGLYVVCDCQSAAASATPVTENGPIATPLEMLNALDNADGQGVLPSVGMPETQLVAYTPKTANAEKPSSAIAPAPLSPTANRSSNLRGGPGTTYPVAGGAAPGQTLDIVGRNAAGDWYALRSGSWIAAFLVNHAPLMSSLPVVDAPLIPVPVSNTRLANGTLVADAYRSGRSEFVFINSRTVDVVFAITRPDGTVVAAIYVQQGLSATLGRIDNGTYGLYIMSGEDWNAGAARFNRRAGYFKAPRLYDFAATETTYDQWTITLGGGDQALVAINAEQFPSLR